MTSLYDELGGAEAIDVAVDKFYEKVLADKRINAFFEGVDMEKQRKMQKKFLTYAFGGPNNYDGRNMAQAHQKLVEKGLNDSHFDAVVENLGATLTELQVPQDKINEAAAIAETVRDDILGRSKTSQA